MSYTGPIVDVDVHHRWKKEGDVTQYLPKRWRDYISSGPSPLPISVPGLSHTALFQNSARMPMAYPADGGPAGSDYGVLREQLLDRYRYFRAVLTHDLGDFGSHLNPGFAAALCCALNDWNIDYWLGLDERLRGLVAIPNGLPAEAAAEIRRVGAHPGMAAVLMVGNPLGRPYGDPVYHPIYDAAAEMNLNISIHASGLFYPNGQVGVANPQPGAGFLTHAQRSQQAEHYISSLIVNGVFEKYPTLKFLIKEYGVAWLPSLIWRLDGAYKWLRAESAWVTRLPSEYIAGHIKLSTQPIEVSSSDKSALPALLGTIGGMENLLCFSTDYPHITFDDPLYLARQLPASWHRKVFCDNACEIYGWTPPSDVEYKRVAALAAS